MPKDTVKLLQECAKGVKMGERAISLTISQTRPGELKQILEDAGQAHAILGDDVRKLLYSGGEHAKEPSTVIQMMSDAKIKAMMSISGSGATAASLITDGCNMGSKSITHYLNKYPKASLPAQVLAHRIIRTEDELRDKLRKFL